MDVKVRKYIAQIDETVIEGGEPCDPRWLIVGVGAIVENPYAGSFAPDLTEMLDAFCPVLGDELTRRVQALIGDAPVEAYGKGGIVGLAGEVEHVSGILHNLKFGNPLRNALGATSLLPSTEKRAAAGATLDVPLKHVHDHRVRSHHQTFEMRVPDGPADGEMFIAMAVAMSGRPHARIGEFGVEVPESERR